MTGIEKELLEHCGKDPLTAYIYRDWLLDHGRAIDAKGVENTILGKVKQLSDLEGKILSDACQIGNEIELTLLTGKKCRLKHYQDCCESVFIEDINGDLSNLVGVPITKAEVNYSKNFDRPPEPDDQGSQTWTFYHFATIKGYVTVRWYGTSNGYYSETVEFFGEEEEDSYN